MTVTHDDVLCTFRTNVVLVLMDNDKIQTTGWHCLKSSCFVCHHVFHHRLRSYGRRPCAPTAAVLRSMEDGAEADASNQERKGHNRRARHSSGEGHANVPKNDDANCSADDCLLPSSHLDDRASDTKPDKRRGCRTNECAARRMICHAAFSTC